MTFKSGAALKFAESNKSLPWLKSEGGDQTSSCLVVGNNSKLINGFSEYLLYKCLI
jgi:hypothetical protein